MLPDFRLLEKAPTDAPFLARGLPASTTPGQLDALLPGLAGLAARERFEGKPGQQLLVPLLGGGEPRHLLLLGTGEGSPAELRRAAGLAGRVARERGEERVVLELGGGEGSLRAQLEGFLLGNYRFERHRSEDARRAACRELGLVRAVESARAEVDLAWARAFGEAQELVRDLVNEVPDLLTPEALAAHAASLATDRLAVEVWDEERIQREGFTGTWMVGRGSPNPPRFVHLHYRPEAEPRARVALVGKGVTFDAGGLSIKPTDGMLAMRCDMAGAATVIGALRAVEALGLPVELHGVFAAAENLVDGASYKLGDVLHMANGKTVEIVNTDAEGRLLLADSLIYASRLGVDRLVDLATLTGACLVALGHGYTGLFTRDDGLASELLDAAERSGDGLWRLPLDERFSKELESPWADIKNVGSRWGGASSAAAFLSHFVDGPRWAHLDIAGPAFLDKPDGPYLQGATASPLGALLYWLESLAAG